MISDLRGSSSPAKRTVAALRISLSSRSRCIAPSAARSRPAQRRPVRVGERRACWPAPASGGPSPGLSARRDRRPCSGRARMMWRASARGLSPPHPCGASPGRAHVVASWSEVSAAALLGLLMGVLVVAAGGTRLKGLVPFVGAFLVTTVGLTLFSGLASTTGVTFWCFPPCSSPSRATPCLPPPANCWCHQNGARPVHPRSDRRRSGRSRGRNRQPRHVVGDPAATPIFHISWCSRAGWCSVPGSSSPSTPIRGCSCGSCRA